MRYGDGGEIAEDARAWHRRWSEERQRRGVGVTGQYVFNAGRCAATGAERFLDAEDPARSNWTRFLNHAGSSANLATTKTVADDGTPTVRFHAARPIDVGCELTIDYGKAYAAWDKPGDALVLFEGIIKSNSKDWRGYLAKGGLLRDLGKSSEAEKAFFLAKAAARAGGGPEAEAVVDRVISSR